MSWKSSKRLQTFPATYRGSGNFAPRPHAAPSLGDLRKRWEKRFYRLAGYFFFSPTFELLRMKSIFSLLTVIQLHSTVNLFITKIQEKNENCMNNNQSYRSIILLWFIITKLDALWHSFNWCWRPTGWNMPDSCIKTRSCVRSKYREVPKCITHFRRKFVGKESCNEIVNFISNYIKKIIIINNKKRAHHFFERFNCPSL